MIAEEQATLGSRPRLESNDYEKASQMIELMQNISPEVGDRFIEMAIAGGEIKDENGKELTRLLKKVCDEKMSEVTQAFREEAESLGQKLTMATGKEKEEYRSQCLLMADKIVDEVVKRLRADERIITSFKGKEEMREKLLEIQQEVAKLAFKAIFARI